MSLTREDKIWLSRLAALIIDAVNEIVCSQFKTQVAISRVKDVLKFGVDDNTLYLEKRDGGL